MVGQSWKECYNIWYKFGVADMVFAPRALAVGVSMFIGLLIGLTWLVHKWDHRNDDPEGDDDMEMAPGGIVFYARPSEKRTEQSDGPVEKTKRSERNRKRVYQRGFRGKTTISKRRDEERAIS